MEAVVQLAQLLMPLQSELALSFAPARSLLLSAFNEGRKVLLCGNGGSAAQASHFAAELVVRYRTDRPALPAIALTDAGVLSATANDYGYQWAFSRQIEALGQPGDVLVAFSTSGKSRNVLEAIAAARRKGMRTLGLTGKTSMACDVNLMVPSTDTARIQECHLLLTHMLCEALEDFKMPSLPPVYE